MTPRHGPAKVTCSLDGLASRETSRSLGRRLAKLACAFAVSLSLAISGVGCKSGGCSSCDLGNKVGNGVRATGATFRNLGAKVFHHKGGAAYGTGATGCCGDSGMVSEGAVEYNPMPMSPGTMMPGMSGLPAEPAGPSMLEPAPKAKNVAPGDSTGVNATGTNKSGYETASPRARGQVRSNANNVALTPAPIRTAGGSQGLNPLDDTQLGIKREIFSKNVGGLSGTIIFLFMTYFVCLNIVPLNGGLCQSRSL